MRNKMLSLTATLLALSASAQTDSVAVAQAAAVAAVKSDKSDLSDLSDKSDKSKKSKKPAKSKKSRAKNAGDADAAKKALKAIIYKYDTHTADTVVKEVVAKFSSDPTVAASAARAYLYRPTGVDVNYMQKYIDQALAYDPKCMEAYLLQADYYKSALGNDTAKAIACYDKVIEVAPTNPVGYDGKADLLRNDRPLEAEAAYDKAGQNIASFPVNLRKARMYNYRSTLITNGVIANDGGETTNKAVNFIKEVERDSMSAEDFVQFSRWYYASGQGDKNYYAAGLLLAQDGIKRYPGNPGIYRVALYNAVPISVFKEAVEYGEKLFANPDTLINAADYYSLERAYFGYKRYEKCISTCRELLAREDATDDHRSNAVQNIARSYKEMGEYEEADKAFVEYIESRKASGSLSFIDMYSYANMYKEKAEESNGQEKVDAYEKAYQLYGEAAKLDLEQAYIAYNGQMIVAETIDADQKRALLLAPGQAIYSILQGKENLDSQERGVLLYACQKVGWYLYSVKKNGSGARRYWDKAYELDPTNNFTQTVMKNVYHMKL